MLNISISKLKAMIAAKLAAAIDPVHVDPTLQGADALALLMNGKPQAAGRPNLPHGQPPARGTMGTASAGYITDPRTGSLVRGEFKRPSRRKLHRLEAANGRKVDAAARGCPVRKPDFSEQIARELAAKRRRAARDRNSMEG